MSTRSRGAPTVTVGADHRDGAGNLIARSVSVETPGPPECFRFSCLWNFYLKVVRHWLVSIYHMKRVVYAEKNRHKTIPVKYRTGEESPNTIKGAIWGITKLSLRSSVRR